MRWLGPSTYGNVPRIAGGSAWTGSVEIDERRFRVPGEDIKEIDHPGNTVLIAGVVVGGFALLMAESNSLADRANADGVAVIGLGLALGGAIPWFRSTGAASGYEDD